MQGHVENGFRCANHTTFTFNMEQLYVLQLESGKYYCGKTTRPSERYKEHIAGTGAAWTKKFKPSQIDYYKAGMPSTNYASLGDREGGKGSKGGELFVSQAETILTLKPKMFRLEMVPTALETNDGHEVECVIAGLSRHYHVDARILDCWRYGDPTSRRRLIIVGGDTDIVQANWYHWPEPIRLYATRIGILLLEM